HILVVPLRITAKSIPVFYISRNIFIFSGFLADVPNNKHLSVCVRERRRKSCLHENLCLCGEHVLLAYIFSAGFCTRRALHYDGIESKTVKPGKIPACASF